MSASGDSGRRLYKARGPDGEVAWVDHNELWRLQHERAEEVRRRRSRRRRVAAAAAAGLLALVAAAIAYRMWSPAAAPVPREAAPAAAEPAGDPAGQPAEASAAGSAPLQGEPAATAAPESLGRGAAAPPPPEERIAGAVRSWAAAWARRDVAAYLASYAAGFTPPDGLSRRQWEALRRRRLLDPPSIRVEIDGLEIALGEAGRAEARFVQTYDSPAYSDVVRKRLELVEEEDGWRIAAEQAAPL